MSAKKTSNKKKSAAVKTTGKPVTKGKRASPKKKTAIAKKAGTGKKTKNNGEETKSNTKDSQKKNKKKSDGIVVEAVRIVEQAAAILEEEISAGIVAAKKVEERYVNVNSLRSGEPQQVMQRFRQDAHEVLDIVLDLVNLSINAVTGLSERTMNIRSTTVPKENNNSKNEDSLAELVIPGVLKPGESGKVGMLVENENENATGQFELSTSGLLNATGEHLAAQHISFNPASLEIGANDMEKVTVTVFIPEDTVPGQYSGVVQASAIHMRVLLTVQVAA